MTNIVTLLNLVLPVKSLGDCKKLFYFSIYLCFYILVPYIFRFMDDLEYKICRTHEV